jgi:serine/threonine-protein kinase
MAAARDFFRLVGTVVDEKYRIDRVLGEGGMGVVYAGTHLFLGQPIAVKCMKPLGATADEEERIVSLFLREARVLFSLTHPGIVRLYDIGVIQRELHQVPYVVLELIDGCSLEAEIARRRAPGGRPFTVAEIGAIFEPVLEALAFAHAAGVAHRDIKPQNLMLVAGASGQLATKIVDFGIARWQDEQRPSSGATGFTPAYGAPEQWDPSLGATGPATDVFAMGLVIEEACTLRSAFREPTPARIFAEVMSPNRRVNIRESRPDVPEALEQVLVRATRLQPRDRHANAAALLEDLRAALRGVSAEAPRVVVTPASTPGAAMATVGDTAVSALMATAAMPRAPAAATSAPIPSHDAAPAPMVETGTPIAETIPHAAPARRPRLAVAIATCAIIAGALVVLVLVRRAAVERAPDAIAMSTAAGSSSAAAPAPPSPFADATVSIDALAAGEALPGAAAADVAAGHTQELLDCYREALARDGAVSGDVSIFVTVTIKGKVYKTEDMDEGTIDPEAVRDQKLRFCAQGAAGSWTYPTHRKNDVAGVLYTFHFRRGAPPAPQRDEARDEPESVAGAYQSVFVLEPDTVYPAAPTQIVQRGSRIIGDYPDGALCCNRVRDKLQCRWIQTDTDGRAILTRRPDGNLVGRWGYEPSDSNAGPWRLLRRIR